MDYKISVAIRTYNEEKHLREVLEALKQQTYQSFEIILLDSGSTDNTIRIASRYNVRVEHIEIIFVIAVWLINTIVVLRTIKSKKESSL